MNTKNFVLLGVLVGGVLFTAGCTTMTRSRLLENSNRVQAGMTETEVIAILGLPDRNVAPFGWPKPVRLGSARWEVSEGPEFDQEVLRVEVIYDGKRQVVTKKVSSSHLRTVPPEFQLQWTRWERDPKGINY